MLANRILTVITTILAFPTVPVQIVTTFVGGCLVSCTFGLLLIPLSIIWLVLFYAPLLGLSWLWDKTPMLRIPLAIIGIPLAAVGSTYVALIPSMGDMPGRWTKLMLCETWPFSMDYWRSLKGIDVPDFERLARIKHVMHRLGLAEPPDTNTVFVAKIFDFDGDHIGNAVLRMGQSLVSESTITGEIHEVGIGDYIEANQWLTIQCFSVYDLNRLLSQFPLRTYEVKPDAIRFNIPEADLKVGPFP